MGNSRARAEEAEYCLFRDRLIVGAALRVGDAFSMSGARPDQYAHPERGARLPPAPQRPEPHS
ncbi:hypothetical protein [Streptomyces albipurpureus]|uniref:Uncharacterized protein n=1 Tax=Streptomyces albipurpureus TaxID=2897419 RepID=A0ABT0UZ01_9ACTN|nr:hypothetical protein [Streptomyces sp. CWNU-1]MCM2393335.1 hypothetical protein [Streptomyces sp. CWNU-1]